MMFDPKDFDPTRYSPPDTLPRFAEACAKLPRKSVIAIHGWCSSGKTPTAKWLGRKLGLKPIHLDDFNYSQRPGFNPETDAYGFDEDAMRAAIDDRRNRETIIVEGVCACRVCSPDVLLDLGAWRSFRLRASVESFIGGYDGPSFTGRLKTFRCEPNASKSA
ncbi:MAG: hypothetical protein ACK5PF_11945 [bacterium]|jgi:hypothetical protein